MMQCLKELLKLYLTWTKFEAKELTRLGEKHGKTLPNISKHPNDDAIINMANLIKPWASWQTILKIYPYWLNVQHKTYLLKND